MERSFLNVKLMQSNAGKISYVQYANKFENGDIHIS